MLLICCGCGDVSRPEYANSKHGEPGRFHLPSHKRNGTWHRGCKNCGSTTARKATHEEIASTRPGAFKRPKKWWRQTRRAILNFKRHGTLPDWLKELEAIEMNKRIQPASISVINRYCNRVDQRILYRRSYG